MKKTLVWWFEDTDSLYESILLNLDEWLNKCTIKRFKSIKEGNTVIGSPELILIDVTTISEIGSPLSCWTLYEMNLNSFIEKHTSSIIGLYSAIGQWAADLIDYIKEEYKDEVVIEPIPYDLSWGIEEFFRKHLKEE